MMFWPHLTPLYHATPQMQLLKWGLTVHGNSLTTQPSRLTHPVQDWKLREKIYFPLEKVHGKFTFPSKELKHFPNIFQQIQDLQMSEITVVVNFFLLIMSRSHLIENLKIYRTFPDEYFQQFQDLPAATKMLAAGLRILARNDAIFATSGHFYL